MDSVFVIYGGATHYQTARIKRIVLQNTPLHAESANLQNQAEGEACVTYGLEQKYNDGR